MTETSKTMEHASGSASAPGDLPLSAVRERDALRGSQFRHDNTIEPRTPTPDQSVTVTATSGATLDILRAEIWYTVDGSWPDASSARVNMQLVDTEWSLSTGYVYRWAGVFPPQPDGTIVRYSIAGYASGASATPDFFAFDGSGFWYRYGEEGLITFAYRVKATPQNLPAWMQNAVIYQIFLDRFHNDSPDGRFAEDTDPHDKHGGTLGGVIRALPYLADLGVNCLWLSPVGPSETYHRYDQSDFLAVDADLGGLAAMTGLVEAARERDMRLILDFVPGHGSWEMPQFRAAQADPDAPTASWFVFDQWPDSYRCFLGVVPSLVSFNSNDDGLRQFLIDSATFWLRDVGFDGLRLDHAIGHGSDFWVHFSDVLERIKPDVALFGEATDTPEMLRRYRSSLQGILDFPLAQILRMSFGRGEWGVVELNNKLQGYFRYMQDGPDRVTFLDNHDMNRFLFEAGGDRRRLKLAVLCLMTLPYSPVIYYGTEVGLSQDQDKDAAGFGGDHEVRRDMVWDPAEWDGDLLAFFKDVVKLRLDHPALRSGQWQPTIVDGGRRIYAYLLEGDGQAIQVFFNLGEDRQRIKIDGAGDRQLLLVTNPIKKTGDNQTLLLEALSGIVTT